MAKYNKQRKRFDEINVIPFIDIMLVLLVMVLTTATFIKQGIIPVDLPEAKTANKEKVEKEVTVYVNAKGEMFFEKEQVDLKQLEEKLAGISKEQTVVLRSDKESKFQDFVSVMDILKRLKHEQLYIITKE
ncbi:MAG: TonB system transport protein ExbD [Sulfurimonas sp.]|nr:TonB system transport protein ExbD [Sulfurimonas sp.]MBU1217867.1 TonB system transport protein ExbD [bacterium]MBU1433334.1 TonB system transport protein ExbD [bacterium]MBU1503448.1 TonB system transport protein ExbD [bacterium]MBU3938075.1 TonB system transport protein ExbD [bacterium]